MLENNSGNNLTLIESRMWRNIVIRSSANSIGYYVDVVIILNQKKNNVML